MSLYRRILVPVDDSSAAQAGLSAAIALAQDQQAVAAGLTPERELIVAPDGHVGRHIVQAAVAWQADLIVIGTHGRQGLSLWLAGSTTETLLHGLNVPLLVVPGKQVDEG